MTDNKNEVMDEYPERYIERKGKSVLCQIIYSKSFPWVCYDLEKGQEFLAQERMGAIMEIDLRQYRYNQDTRHTDPDTIVIKRSDVPAPPIKPDNFGYDAELTANYINEFGTYAENVVELVEKALQPEPQENS